MEISFEHANSSLFAVDTGTGRPVVLLHGGLATHVACRRFAEPLSARHRLITPDLRGSGRSRFAGELTWDQLADDVVALLAHLGLPRAAIGGISAGAAVATRVALRHPAATSALILLTPAFGGADLGLLPAQTDAMQRMDAAARRALVDGTGVLLELFPPELRERARELVASYDPASVAATTRLLASGAQPFDRAGELAAIAAPTLVVPGTDPQHPRAVADVFARHVPRVTVVDTTDFAGAIATFLTALA